MTRDQLKQLEVQLWSAADNLRANSDLKASEYSIPVLGLIFLKFADNKFRQHEAAIQAEFEKKKGTRMEKSISDIAIEKCGFYLPPHARYDYLLTLPESAEKLLERLKMGTPHVLVQDWFKDNQSKKQVRSTVEAVLNEQLPETYDRAVFTDKCNRVFELMVDYASHGLKWAA